MGTRNAIVIGRRVGERQLLAAGDELRETRLAAGLSQAQVAGAAGMSRSKYCRIEAGRSASLSVVELSILAAVVGLDSSVRLYPGGRGIRDAGHADKLQQLLRQCRPPLRFAIEVALPAALGRLEQRAWDAMVFGGGRRTAIELEMRLRDVQAMRRRIDLKRRDDPVESFVLLVADTRTNRRVVAEFADLFADLPSLRASAVRSVLAAGQHPPTGLLLI